VSKFFVTGGAGFIGSHLADKLINEGNQVTVYDNLVSGKKKDIEHLIDKIEFRFIQADMLDFKKLTTSMKGHDIVWHLELTRIFPMAINRPTST
jgi:UDP-glucose 4-epimerase